MATRDAAAPVKRSSLRTKSILQLAANFNVEGLALFPTVLAALVSPLRGLPK